MPQPSGIRTQLPVLTAIRGIAAWWVVLFHFKFYLAPHVPAWTYGVIARGDLAVDLFFCLSGFVIYVNYYKLAPRPGPVAEFYIKRLARIYPLHLLFLALYGCLALALVGFSTAHRVDYRFGLWSLAANVFLVQDWGTLSSFSWNVPGWSISAEFAAYLAFPFLLVGLRYRRGTVAGLSARAVLALGAVAAIFTVAGSDLGGNIPSLGVPRCMGQFAAGMALAELYLRLQPRLSRYAAVPLASGLALCGSCLVFDLPTAVCMPPAWAAIVFGLALDRTAVSRALSARRLVWAGEISYATYMCHYFVYDVFKLTAVGPDLTSAPGPLLAALAGIAVWSALLYRYVERPCQSRLVAALLGRRKTERRVPAVCEGVS